MRAGNEHVLDKIFLAVVAPVDPLPRDFAGGIADRELLILPRCDMVMTISSSAIISSTVRSW